MRSLDIVLFIVLGVILILSLIPGWKPKWKRILEGLLLPGLWLLLTKDAIRDGDRWRIALAIAVWPVILWPYVKRLWFYLKRRHV